MSPFFSIIIPTYNRAYLLMKAVQSVISQKFSDFEVIVVDDGSTDDSAELILEMAMSEKRILYYPKLNEERSIARNFGIGKARGKYISFLDSDDFLYDNHLTTAFSLLSAYDFPEVGHLGFESRDESGQLVTSSNNFDNFTRSQLLTENCLHGNAIFIRHDIAKEIKFIHSPAATISEDWYLWLRLAARFRFYFDNTVTSCVTHHRERSLNQIDARKLEKSTLVIVDYLQRDEVFMREFRAGVRSHFANHFTLLTLHLALQNYKGLALAYLFKAIRWDFTVVFRKRFLASLKYIFFGNLFVNSVTNGGSPDA